MQDDNRDRIKKLSPLKKLIFSGFAILLGLGCVHVITDLAFIKHATTQYGKVSQMYVTHPQLGFWTKPDIYESDLDDDVNSWTHLNNKGYRESEDTHYVKPEDVAFRAVAFGDSVFFGHGVKYGSGLLELLEDKINEQRKNNGLKGRFELINTAIPCLNPSHHLVLWQIEAKNYNPELVIGSVCPNDPFGDYKFERGVSQAEIDGIAKEEYLKNLAAGAIVPGRNPVTANLERFYQWLVPRNSLVSFMNRMRLDSAKSRRSAEIEEFSNSEDMDTIMQPYLMKMNLFLDSLGDTPCFYVIFPSEVYIRKINGDAAVSSPFNFEKEVVFREETLSLLQARNIPYLDISKVFLEYLSDHPDESPSVLYLCPGDVIHPSIKGHELISEAMYKSLIDRYNELSK